MSEMVDSRHDLTDELNINDAEAWLARAEGKGEAALAAWAREWGRPAVQGLRELHALAAAADEEGDDDE